MTTPLVLAPFPPPADTDHADRTLARNVVRVASTTLATHDDTEREGQTRRVASQWTGTPLRAIVPLPRRARACMDANGNRALEATGTRPLPCLARASRDGAGETDSEGEHAREDGDGCDAPSGPRYRSYESITAAGGLSAYSFEELRVECYAQSLIATGTRPPPVVRPSLAIPPAFVPRIISRH